LTTRNSGGLTVRSGVKVNIDVRASWCLEIPLTAVPRFGFRARHADFRRFYGRIMGRSMMAPSKTLAPVIGFQIP
jgi:hypothetical protein